jgi:hypothetical protein
MADDMIEIAVTVNGTAFHRRAEARLLLSDFLRHELTLAGGLADVDAELEQFPAAGMGVEHHRYSFLQLRRMVVRERRLAVGE